MPVRQISRDGEIPHGGFEVVDGVSPRRLFEPTLSTVDGVEILQEDVSHFFRAPNPLNRNRTLTMCNGMFARGTLGAVRALTDARFRDRNGHYAQKVFAGKDSFSILSRVPIVNGVGITPDWNDPQCRLHTWPAAS